MNKRITILAIIFASLLLIALFVGGKFPYLLFFLPLVVYGYSYYSMKKVREGLAGVFWCDKAMVEKGDEVDISYKIYNSSIFPLAFAEITDGVPESLNNQPKQQKIYFMLPFESINITRQIKCEHRGIFDIGTVNVVTGDIFGISKKNYLVKDSIELMVYPKVYKLDCFDILGKEFFGSIPTSQKFYEDYSSIKDIRKYRIGDSLKRVNWKVTARKGEMFVKNYDISTNAEIQLFIDFQIDKYSSDTNGYIEEKIIECAVSIIEYALYRKVSTNFVAYTEEKVQLLGKDIDMFNKFLELMVRIKPKKNISLGDILVNESRAFSPGTSVIVVTPNIDKKLISTVLRLKRRGYSIILVLVNDFDRNKAALKGVELLEKSGTRLYKVDLKDSINNVLR